ncbi:MAG: type IV pilus twitching motility protein PilT [PS1 clade bacterium]|nr:twitching motility protein PilT [Rhodobiaceae bacterium]MBL6786776.1 type IV pilus twitching motility protein PilT [PS1 clade bacterium]CAI8398136.1 MAG: Twitching mobility protein [Rhodobiaceae bacterium UBA7378]HCQ81251.1 twitching motility protein PilT [Rhodobiaceae bacterium]
MSDNPIYGYLETLPKEYRVSDFHMRSGSPLAMRVNGEIEVLQDLPITHDLLDALFREELSDEDYDKFCETRDIDFAMTVAGQRFRANGYHTMRGWALILRTIVTDVPNIDQLGLPQAVHNVLKEKKGLVLVTGQTGSGKSTSLASMINKINRERAEHIITIEDPIEFVHTEIRSIISQREVGRDTMSFGSALKSALREDPDIILVGEMRDYETVSLALTAAETEHLVFGTLHTSGAAETINRIIDVFPAEEQSQARSQLSSSLQLVMTQQLLKRKTGGRIGAFEVMVCVPAVRNLIREDKIPQIGTVMQTGAQFGIITMDKYVDELEKQNLIVIDDD